MPPQVLRANIRRSEEANMTVRMLVVVGFLALAGCDAVDTIKEGINHANAVSARLQTSLGTKPAVGFNSQNGELTNVTVTFAGEPPGFPLDEIAAKTREAVRAEFKQSPKHITLSFDLAQ
jgi:hypothetical protein